MHQAPQALYELIGPVIDRLGYELVGLDYRPQAGKGLLRVYIDAPAGVTLDDCERVSHQVSGLLDVEDPIQGAYILEVSSPGLDRPLFRPEDFSRFAGHRVRVQLHTLQEGRRKYTGVLRGLRGDTVVIDEDGHEAAVPLDNGARANLVPEV